MGESQADHTIAESLYMISMGTNDFLENYYSSFSRRQEQYNVTQYQDFLVGIAENFIKQIYGLGARKISVGGLPPMGCMPLERTTNLMGQHECVNNYNNVALQFNAKMNRMIVRLNKELHGVNLVFSNPYDAMMQIIEKPAQYGEFLLLLILD